MTENNYYEWAERYLASAASDGEVTNDNIGEDEVDDKSIDQTVNIGWSAEQTFSGGIDLDSNNINNVETLNSSKVNTGLLDTTKSFTLAYLSSAQTITSGSVTKVALDAVESDHLGGFDTTNNEFVVQDDGDYAVSGQIYWNSDSNWSTGDRADPRPNAAGTRIAGPQTSKSGTSDEGVAIPTSARTLTAGDVIDLRCYQGSGADQTLDGVKAKTFLTIQKVG